MAGPDAAPERGMEYEQVGLRNVVMDQGEYRRWVRDQIGRSISGQLTILVSLLGSGGVVAIAAGAWWFLNTQLETRASTLRAEMEEELRDELRRETELFVRAEVAGSIANQSDLAQGLAELFRNDPVARRRFTEQMFTPDAVGALTGNVASQRAVDAREDNVAIRLFALDQAALFAPDLLPAVVAELLLSDGAPLALYEKALEYYDHDKEGTIAAPAEVRLPLVQQLRDNDANATWETLHEQVIGKVLDRLLTGGGAEDCITSPAFCTFFANLPSDKAEPAFARFAAHLRGEGAAGDWDVAIEPLAAVDGTRGLLRRAPDLYAAARAGGRVSVLGDALEGAIARFQFANYDDPSFADASVLDVLDGALGASGQSIADREAIARLFARSMADALRAASATWTEEEPAAASAVDALVPRTPPEIERTVQRLVRTAADTAATRQSRAVALHTLDLMLGIAPQASAELRLALEMADLRTLGEDEALADLVKSVRDRAQAVFPWQGAAAYQSAAVHLGERGAAAAGSTWLRVDLAAADLAGDLPIAIDVSGPLTGYIVVGDDGALIDGALAPTFAAGRTQILVDRVADAKSMFVRIEPSGGGSVQVSAPHLPLDAPAAPIRGGAIEEMDLGAAYRLAPEAAASGETWLRFTAPEDGFYRLALYAPDGEATPRVYPEGGSETVPATWYAAAGESYDILFERFASPVVLRLAPAVGVRLGVGESQRHSFEAADSLELSLRDLPSGVYRLVTSELQDVDTMLELFDAEGQSLATDDDGGDESLASAVRFTVRREQSYSARVTAYQGGGLGEFTVGLERLGDWMGPAARLAAGGSVRLSFATSNPLEVDLPALPGGVYRIQTFDLDGVDTVLELLDAEGERIAEDDDGGDESFASAVRFTVRGEEQSFIASIRSYDATATSGELSVRLERVGDWGGPAASLGAGQSVDLSFAQANPVEISLPALPAGAYRVSTFGLGPDVDTVMELLTADGDLLAEDDDSGDEALASAVTFSANEGESFIANIRSYDEGSRGTFSLRLERVGN